MLQDNPQVTTKMKFHVPEAGPWMLRLRSNICHLFHGNDAIEIGICKAQVENLKIKLSVKIKDNKFKAVKPCPKHEEKYRSKVLFIDMRSLQTHI